MMGKTFLNAVGHDEMDILQLFLGILAETGSQYCVVGGLAVNAYVEPVVSLDLDIVVAAGEVDRVAEAAKRSGLRVETFRHSVNFTSPKSDLRIQLQIDPRYQAFLSRAVETEVLGYRMRVASVRDVLQGKAWAYLDATRRKSKRQKDLADIMRLVEADPALEAELPPEIRAELK
jgi:hypothetical protein